MVDPPDLNRLYSRPDIHEMFGGDLRSYLPTRGGTVVCGCFDPSLNRRAPLEIDVGYGPKVLASAEALVSRGTTIPVFLREASNAWRFVGHYRPIRLSRAPEDLRAHADRRSDAVAVLFLDEVEQSDAASDSLAPDLELLSAVEGRALLRRHIARERKPSLIAAKKRLLLAAEGTLVCEACGLRSSDLPSDLGDACFEGHHLVPLADLKENEVLTRLDDLALLCANCHRMVHSARPLIAVDQLKEILARSEATPNTRLQRPRAERR